ncbi:ParA family protein [Metabacillus iocasae]|uniref:Cellulose biosynthesis protein BcsQ n=1 Tax=Priestia iocasae TaxID=2291674 RepID=A0ABS2QX31_9BACI|nr:AAA family ATPase [Metabacillus iocasae]MBM7703512.1 cellulose biosynthesis protein BcsQ [Metabacillus iocasae]
MTTAKKIFVGNYKGGVGKTTSVYQLALHMIETGKRVLLIDLDPQCSLSEICLSRMNRNLDHLQPNECLNYIYDVWVQTKSFPYVQIQFDAHALIKTTDEGVCFIPSNMFYPSGGLDDLALKLQDDFYDLLPLQQFFQSTKLEAAFDYILFDCPPTSNMMTKGAFLLSNYYLIPSIIQTVSLRGIVHYIKTVNTIYDKTCEKHSNAMLGKQFFGEKPKLVGIFETMKKGSVNNRDELNELKQNLKNAHVQTALKGRYLFQTIIKSHEHIARKTANGEKCSEYEPLTNEIIECVEGTEAITLASLGDKHDNL